MLPYKTFHVLMLVYLSTLFLHSALVGKFDAIWDRGSLVAMDPPDRAG